MQCLNTNKGRLLRMAAAVIIPILAVLPSCESMNGLRMRGAPKKMDMPSPMMLLRRIPRVQRMYGGGEAAPTTPSGESSSSAATAATFQSLLSVLAGAVSGGGNASAQVTPTVMDSSPNFGMGMTRSMGAMVRDESSWEWCGHVHAWLHSQFLDCASLMFEFAIIYQGHQHKHIYTHAHVAHKTSHPWEKNMEPAWKKWLAWFLVLRILQCKMNQN
jgi:hypothetical protein